MRSLIYSWNMVDPIDGDVYYQSDIRSVPSLADIPVAQLDLPLSLSKSAVYWKSYADYLSRMLSVDYRIENEGTNDALEVKITGSSNSNGVTLSTGLPVPVGDILAGKDTSVTLRYIVPPGVGAFRASLTAGAKDANRNIHTYP